MPRAVWFIFTKLSFDDVTPHTEICAGSRLSLVPPREQETVVVWEDQPHIQGAVAAWAQEGLEELSHVEGQEGRW